MKASNIRWSSPITAGVAAVAASVLWGSAFPVLKLTYEQLNIAPGDYGSQIYLAGLRFFLAALLLFPYLRFGLRRPIAVGGWQRLLPLFILGIFQTALQYFFFYGGVANTTGINSAILHSSGTFMLVIAAHFLYRDDRMTWGKWIGLTTGLAGILLVNWRQAADGLDFVFSFQGEGFLLISGAVSTAGMVLAKRLAGSMHPVLVNAWQLFFGSLFLIAVGTAALEHSVSQWTPMAVLLLVYSAALSAAAFSLWYTVLKHHRAGEVAVYRFMIPVTGALLSAVFLPDERFSLMVLLSLICVSAGIVSVYHFANHDSKR